MSIQEALITRSYPQVISARITALLNQEVAKGCQPGIHPFPIDIEPFYQPLSHHKLRQIQADDPPPIQPTPSKTFIPMRVRVWLDPDESFNWIKPELFIKQLTSSQERFAFEIAGNDRNISISFLCHKDDLPLLQAALRGLYPTCGISQSNHEELEKTPLRDWEHVVFFDYYPHPPYTHLLTRPLELQISPLESLVHQLAAIPHPTLGLYQVIFQPVNRRHDWHRNMEILLDLEYKLTLYQDGFASSRMAQQSPAMDLRTASQDINNKAHNDKPFFATAVRTMIVSGKRDSEEHLMTLHSIVNLFQHGGKALQASSEKAYFQQLPPANIRDMLLHAQTYRPGFLLNSWELTGLVHLPTSKHFVSRNVLIQRQETLQPQSNALNRGTFIGCCITAEGRIPIHIPASIKLRHTHILGRNGVGKSHLMEMMAVSDVEAGHGIAVLDPHGDLVEGILKRIPKPHIGRIIYLEPGNSEWVPLWNPLARMPGQDRFRLADDLVGAFKSIVDGWGDRLERILRNCFLGLLVREQSTLLDVYKILHRDSEESKRIRADMLQKDLSYTEQLFWKFVFDKFSKEALEPPLNKKDKLMSAGSVSLMLSQKENRIHFRRIMDQGLVLLINLANAGSEARDILGSFILSLFHLTALSRADLAPNDRRPFHIYCDEAHRFIAGSIEDIVTETRKFGVSLTLANQYLAQFPPAKRDGLSNVGTTILFNIDSKDAQFVQKNLRELVEINDIASLGVGQAIARIGTEIVRFETVYQPPPEKHYRRRILEHSFQQYYKSVQQVKNDISQQNAASAHTDQTRIHSQTGSKSHEEYKFSEL